MPDAKIAAYGKMYRSLFFFFFSFYAICFWSFKWFKVNAVSPVLCSMLENKGYSKGAGQKTASLFIALNFKRSAAQSRGHIRDGILDRHFSPHGSLFVPIPEMTIRWKKTDSVFVALPALEMKNVHSLHPHIS